MKKEKTFAKGFIFKKAENAPDFVIGNLSIKVDEAIEFIKSNENNNWVNLDIKKSKDNKFYIELNTYKKSDLPF
jgi:hypothetical protein